MKKPFQTLDSQIVWSSPWYAIRQDRILLPNGEEGVYNVVQKNDAVWVVPLTAAGEIVLIRNYRYTVDDWCWEVPAGNVEAGQTAHEAAASELAQEVGGSAARWQTIGRFYLANGISDEVGHILLAEDVVLGQTAHEPTEVMTVHVRPWATVVAMAQNGEITDGPSALALLLCAARLGMNSRGPSPDAP